MPDAGTEKMQRLLLMQERLLDGKVLHKTDCADEFHVTAKTIQRDLETLRLFFAERKDGREIVYDQQRGAGGMQNPFGQPVDGQG